MSKRKKYTGPKYVAKNPLKTFFGNMSITHGEHLQTTLSVNAAAMQAIMQGRGDKEHWDRLVGALNVALVMSESGIGPEYRQDLIAGREALLACGVRSVKNDRFLFNGNEIAILNEALEIHEAQLVNSRSIDVDRAAAEVVRRLRYCKDNVSVTKEISRSESAMCA